MVLKYNFVKSHLCSLYADELQNTLIKNRPMAAISK